MKTNRLAITVVVAVAALSALACSSGETKGSSPTHSAVAASAQAAKVNMELAQTFFNTRCVVCHGTEGNGNGPGSVSVTPKPRDYTDKAWQSSVTDEQIRKTILLGGAGVGKSPMMPGCPDLDEKPEVVEGLVKIVRKFGG